MNSMIKNKLLTTAVASIGLMACSSAQATIVEFQTNKGNFEVNLYDQTTPKTVANFLQYLNDGDYANVIFHRSVSGFVVQGGGFAYNNSLPLLEVHSNPPVANEPVYSNVKGSIAMAKLSGDANSATNQWFFNLANNSSNLDNTNGGFTVFGEVIGDGMSVINNIASTTRYNLGGAFAEIPLQNYDGVSEPDGTNFIIISAIIITDTTVASAASLNPPKTTRSTSTPSTGGGGGSFGALIVGLALLAGRKLLKQ